MSADHWDVGNLNYLDCKELRSWLRHPWQTFQWWIIWRNQVR